jgi:hypothetical protein
VGKALKIEDFRFEILDLFGPSSSLESRVSILFFTSIQDLFSFTLQLANSISSNNFPTPTPRTAFFLDTSGQTSYILCNLRGEVEFLDRR